MMKHFILYSLVIVALSSFAAFGLGGCGIKPGDVDPPPGAEDRTFPRTYPDPATDPRPIM